MSAAADIEVQSTELLRTLIRNGCVNTGEESSGHEDRSCDALEAFFAGSGLSCERYTSSPGRTSLISRIEGSDKKAPTLLLMGHTDVVPVSPSGWKRDPFAADLVDGVVWGRGAIDMLNLTSTMAVATRRLATSGWRPRGHPHLPGRRRRGGGRRVRRRAPGGERARRGAMRLRHHRERRRAHPHPVGLQAARLGRREGRQLAPPHRARHARARLAPLPHRQCPRHRRHHHPAHRRLPAQRPHPRPLEELHHGAGPGSRADRRSHRSRARVEGRARHGQPDPRAGGACLHPHHVLPERGARRHAR